MAYQDSSSVGTSHIIKSSPAGLLGLTKWTWSFWIKPTGTAPAFFTYIFSCGSIGNVVLSTHGTGERSVFVNTANKLEVYVDYVTTDLQYITTDTLTNAWQYFCIRVQAGACTIFRGTLTTAPVEVSYATATNGVGTIVAETGSYVTLGAGNQLNTGTFGGGIDAPLFDFAMYAVTVVSPNNTWRTAPSKLQIGSNNLNLWWRLNEAVSGTGLPVIMDYSYRGNHGTTAASALWTSNPPLPMMP